MLFTVTHRNTHSRQCLGHTQHMRTKLDTLVVLRAVDVLVHARARGVGVLAADTLIANLQHPDAIQRHMGPSRQNPRAKDTPVGFACKTKQQHRPHRHFLATCDQRTMTYPLL